MELHLTPEQERLIAAALRTGHYRTPAEVLDDALHALEEKQRGENISDSEKQQALERLRSFGKSHGLSLGQDLTIKDLINEGRR